MSEQKPFVWSHSRLQSFETCPRRHYECDVARNFVEAPTAALTFGSDLHKALELFCRDGVPMPPEFRTYQDVADKIVALPGDKAYEQKLALDEQFQPCDFMDPKAWFRCVVDVLILHGKIGGVIDYKTGKIKGDPAQLQLNAAAIFAHYPDVDDLELRFWWIAKGKTFTTFRYSRKDLPDIWNKFLPRVSVFRKAVETQRWVPNPSGLCKRYCPVTTCAYHGK